MAYGLLLLRVAVGGVFFAHGAQKLFGWWGGGGLRGTAGWLGSAGFRPPLLMALLVAVAESSGALLALGLATPFAAFAVASAMVVAVGSVHWKNGFFSGNGGYEFNLVLWSAAVALAATGPGRFSVDRALGWDDNLSGVWWGAGALVASLAVGGLVLASRRKPAA
ncbi:MAG TPA: DoxX family protein [Gaiellaceae bacterium]|nr:DoxX family protein [Gaiellaceae bacterium]